ncbi:monocarboxylate transporter 14-like [Ruditapes philippinarum]|uniref:monocarboxylate transporter 14-like n=1 Tax=Ruditapes philippinarum TaxID=129788 RepID=UPI00295B0FBC|nr:monocarboxylate transporter 14-like [Ruditapes philippinarum]
MCVSRLKQFEGGWAGLIVLVSSFLTWVCAFGTSVSIGIYNLDFADYFNIGSAEVSLIGSINTGFLFGAGPIAGVLMSKWSYRKVAVVGAILSSIGLVAFVFSPNVLYAYFFYGVLNGLGNCLAVTASQVSCGQHYVKYRGITSSFVISGTGFGSALFPIIINYLIKVYGWRGSLLFLSGINLHMLVFTLLLLPVKASSQIQSDRRLENKMKNRKKSLSDIYNDKSHEIKEDIETLGKFQIKCKYYLQKLKRNISTILNFKFFIFLTSTILFNFGYNAIVIFLPQHSIAIGYNEGTASLALTLVGAGLFVGCIIGSLLGNYNCKIIVLIIGSFGFGISSILIKVSQVQYMYMSLSFLAGLSSGLETAYLLTIACEILGDDAMAIGFGFVLFAVGVGCMIGPPITGYLVDNYQDTDYVLYVSAIVTILSGVIMLPYPLISVVKKCSRSRTSEQSTHPSQSTITLVSVITDMNEIHVQ